MWSVAPGHREFSVDLLVQELARRQQRPDCPDDDTSGGSAGQLHHHREDNLAVGGWHDSSRTEDRR